jgi:MFS family permease
MTSPRTHHAAPQGKGPGIGVVLAVTLAVQTLIAFAMTSPGVLGPTVTHDLGVAAESLGYYALVMGIAAAVTSPWIGAWIHHLGAFRVNQLGVLVVAVSLLVAATGWLPMLWLGAILLGAGQAVSMPTGAQLLARVTPPERLSVVLSIRQAGLPIGAALCGVVLPFALGFMSWRQSLVAFGLLMLVSLVFEAPLRRHVEGERHVKPTVAAAGLRATMRALMANRELMLISLCSFCFSFAQNSLMVYMVSFLNLEIGYSLSKAGAVMAITYVVALGARLFWGWVADRVGNSFYVLGGLGLAAAVLNVITGFFTADWPFWLIGLVGAAMGATMTAWNGVFAGGIVRYSPEGQSGAMMGASNVFGYGGMLLGPPVCALFISGTGTYASVFFVACAILVPVSFHLIRAGRTTRPH